jgi:hypothetical protein
VFRYSFGFFLRGFPMRGFLSFVAIVFFLASVTSSCFGQVCENGCCVSQVSVSQVGSIPIMERVERMTFLGTAAQASAPPSSSALVLGPDPRTSVVYKHLQGAPHWYSAEKLAGLSVAELEELHLKLHASERSFRSVTRTRLFRRWRR